MNCYSPEGWSWGKMNDHNWRVMDKRTQRGEYVRNTNTQCPGWPYQILAVEPPASPTASPPGSAHDGADDEPPVHRRRTSVAAEPPDAIITGTVVLTPGPEASSSSVAGMPRRLPPPPPQRPVVILTLGVTLVHRWFNQGQGLRPPRCACVVHEQAHGGRSRGGGLGPVIKERDLEVTVKEMLQVAQKPTGTVILVDARGFKTHQRDTYHIGTHELNLQGILRHPNFLQVWPRLTRRLPDALLDRDHSRPADVAFYCKSGKHRSVGLAWALTHMLRELGWNVDLWHSMREYWHIGSCRECPQCAADNPSKLALLANVRRASRLLPKPPTR